MLADAGHVAFRCDGDEQIGAGHVARCLVLARALERTGWTTSFIGAYEGIAGWLLARAGADPLSPEPAAPCGVPPKQYDLAVVDSYAIPADAICELAQSLPLVTIAEANRCPSTGLLLDYHLDRDDATDAESLTGPSFAPLDPAFAGIGRAGAQVRRLLVTVGGSSNLGDSSGDARALTAEIARAAHHAFPRAEIVRVGSPQSETNEPPPCPQTAPPRPCSLLDALPQVDMAITAAGLTSYELACAGVPQVAVAVVSNQRRVVDGLRRHDLAPCLDLTRGDSLADLPAALMGMRDGQVRRRLSERGIRTFDGLGAARAAAVLTERFARTDARAGHSRPATES